MRDNRVVVLQSVLFRVHGYVERWCEAVRLNASKQPLDVPFHEIFRPLRAVRRHARAHGVRGQVHRTKAGVKRRGIRLGAVGVSRERHDGSSVGCSVFRLWHELSDLRGDCCYAPSRIPPFLTCGSVFLGTRAFRRQSVGGVRWRSCCRRRGRGCGCHNHGWRWRWVCLHRDGHATHGHHGNADGHHGNADGHHGYADVGHARFIGVRRLP
mmetsp:Transcript_10595/g.23969  ORF Transcript_10595/g.23969 Transcript_10595/m.23969 type:complete len:211 (+) Transcript_10595:622-1254(+)